MAASDEWYTPDTPKQPVISSVATALGGRIGLDPTADPDRRVPAARHFTKDDDCLTREARGETIFCNPPFSNPLPFLRWCANQVEEGRSPQAIMLCKSGVLSNQGTGALIQEFATATCHWRHNGRIRFTPGAAVLERLSREFEAGRRASCRPTSADFDTILINFGPFLLFAQTFERLGHVQLCRRAWEELLKA